MGDLSGYSLTSRLGRLEQIWLLASGGLRMNLRFILPSPSLVVLAGLVVLALAAYQGAPFGPTPAQAAVITVDTLNDENDVAGEENGFCALREAINNANNDNSTNPDCDAGTGTDNIVFDPVVFAGGQTISLSSDLFNITDADGLTIDGGGLVTVDGAGAHRLFDFSQGANVLRGITLTNGFHGSGGGIFVVNPATLELSDSIVQGNEAEFDGGGIYNSGGIVTIIDSRIGPDNEAEDSGGGIFNDDGTMTITGSTVVGNSSLGGGGFGADSGGGIFNLDGDLLLVNSTISGNTSATVGGGIFNVFGEVTLINVTVANNTAEGEDFAGTSGGGLYHQFPNTTFTFFLTNTIIAGNTPDDCGGFEPGFDSLGNNLDSDDTCVLTQLSDFPAGIANLGLLASNGGPTQTHALQTGSEAIDAGNNTTCGQAAPDGSAPFDQRGSGFDRISDGICDIGAFEVQVAPPEEPTTVPEFVPDPLTPAPTNTPVPTPTLAPVATQPAEAQAPITPPATGDGGLR